MFAIYFLFDPLLDPFDLPFLFKFPSSIIHYCSARRYESNDERTHELQIIDQRHDGQIASETAMEAEMKQDAHS